MNRLIGWKVGVEVELIAPAGSSRRALAERVADSTGGSLETFFFRDAEPSKVEGMGVFQNLTPAFVVLHEDGRWPWCRFVDDITITEDLDATAPPQPGWVRIVSDDVRLLELASLHAEPNAPIATILDPLAELFFTEVHRAEGGEMARVTDRHGRPIAIATGLPGERERTCEVVTGPLMRGDLRYLAELLGHARALDFSVPKEGATHLHFDGARLEDPAALRNLAAIVVPFRNVLRERVGTNLNCTRLGPWSDGTMDVLLAPDFAGLDWAEARRRLLATEPSKYCDVNIRNLVYADPYKPTVEFRILPGTLDVEDVYRWGVLLVKILRRAVEGPAIPWTDPTPLEVTAESHAALDALIGA